MIKSIEIRIATENAFKDEIVRVTYDSEGGNVDVNVYEEYRDISEGEESKYESEMRKEKIKQVLEE